jgi:hypothetical protein
MVFEVKLSFEQQIVIWNKNKCVKRSYIIETDKNASMKNLLQYKI